MGIGQSKDFDTSKLNSFWDVIVLSHEPIDTFVVASGIAFATLRRHKIARYGPILILLASIVTPLLSYSITSAVIATVHRAASFVMYPVYAMFWGCGLTLSTTFFSFSRVLATL